MSAGTTSLATPLTPRKIGLVPLSADSIDDGRYYRYAAFMPVVLTTAGFLVALAIPQQVANPFLRGIHDLGMGLAFIGFYALVPYGLFMAIVWRFFRPEGLRAHRRIAILAPLYIAMACTVIVSLFALHEVSWRDLPMAVAVIGAYPLGVGYFYAALAIAAAESAGAFASWRRHRTTPVAPAEMGS